MASKVLATTWFSCAHILRPFLGAIYFSGKGGWVQARHWRDQVFRDRYETETLGSLCTRPSPRPRLRPLNLARLETETETLLHKVFMPVTSSMVKVYIRDRVRDRDLENGFYESETETETLESRDTRDETRVSSVSGVNKPRKLWIPWWWWDTSCCTYSTCQNSLDDIFLQ